MIAPEQVTHVLYHANCADGFGAALAAWEILGERAEYIPVNHGQEPPEMGPEARVAVVDFSYPRETLLSLRERVAQLMVLDHHKSAEEDLRGLDFALFDNDKSGARMAWEFWHPQKPFPELLAYVEDRDLWRWQLPDSRAVSLALHCHDMNFEVWLSLELPNLVKEGRAILRFQQQMIRKAVGKAHLRQVAGFEVPTTNSCMLASEIGDELCKLYPEAPFAGVYYQKPDGTQAWSLRSIGEFDVSEVAVRFGGGGHRNAAGFALPHAFTEVSPA